MQLANLNVLELIRGKNKDFINQMDNFKLSIDFFHKECFLVIVKQYKLEKYYSCSQLWLGAYVLTTIVFSVLIA